MINHEVFEVKDKSSIRPMGLQRLSETLRFILLKVSWSKEELIDELRKGMNVTESRGLEFINLLLKLTFLKKDKKLDVSGASETYSLTNKGKEFYLNFNKRDAESLAKIHKILLSFSLYQRAFQAIKDRKIVPIQGANPEVFRQISKKADLTPTTFDVLLRWMRDLGLIGLDRNKGEYFFASRKQVPRAVFIKTLIKHYNDLCVAPVDYVWIDTLRFEICKDLCIGVPLFNGMLKQLYNERKINMSFAKAPHEAVIGRRGEGIKLNDEKFYYIVIWG